MLDMPVGILRLILDHACSSETIQGRSFENVSDLLSVGRTCKILSDLASAQLENRIRVLDAMYPADGDSPPVCIPSVCKPPALLQALRIVGRDLEVLRLPSFPKTSENRNILEEILALCPNLRELLLTDDGFITVWTADKTFSNKRRLRKITLCKPGSAVFFILTHGALSEALQDFSFLQFDLWTFELFEGFLARKGKYLKSLCLGFEFDNSKIPPGEYRDRCDTYMGKCLAYFWKEGRTVMPRLEFLKLKFNVMGNWLDDYLRRLFAAFGSHTSVEVEIMDIKVSLVPPSFDGPYFGKHFCLNLGLCLGSPFPLLAKAFEDGLMAPHTLLISRCRALSIQYNFSRELGYKYISGVMTLADPFARKLVVRQSLDDVNEFRTICQCVTDIMSLSSNIRSLEISREIIGHSSSSEARFLSMLEVLKNIQMFLLNAPENYDEDMKGDMSMGNARIIEGLPVFLDMVRKTCPNLKCIYFERAGASGCNGEKKLPAIAIRTAIEKVQELETLDSDFDASTLKAQLSEWQEECLR